MPLLKTRSGEPNNNDQTTIIQMDNNISTTPSSTNSGKSLQFCRICHDGDYSASNNHSSASSSLSIMMGGRGERLIAPCKCTGTVALIHLSCLEHWLTSSNSDQCEICHHVYKINKEPRSCNDYLRDSDNQFNVRNLIADLICFFLLTPLLILSTYLCVLGANQYFMRERWEAVGLIVLSLFLLGVYLTWCHVTIRYHCSVWRSWQRTNQRVRVILRESEQVEQGIDAIALQLPPRTRVPE